MKRILVSTLAAAVVLGATPALAAGVTAAIKSIDSKTHEVVLDNGQTYVFPAKTKLSKLKVGEKVKVTYETKNGKNEASSIKAAS
jgi:Cu/Ag efflux protein CusF